MGWYNHPDTLSIAIAKGDAKATGHPEGSLEFKRAFRDAYDKQNRGQGLDEKLDAYLKKLDEQIEIMAKRCRSSIG
jgi:hypothetical protein